ncbi:MAG: hypothetical protein NXH95_15940 [Pseudomonadaceae bacterium]|nr:hypothetical protein [Pseudomonadaceae bacterium]
MKKRKTHARRRSAANTKTLVTYGVGIVVFGGGLVFAALDQIGKPVANEIGCYTEIDGAKTVALVDASDPRWSLEQARSLHNYFDGLWNDLDFNERLSVYTSEGDQIGSVPRPRFGVCGQARSSEELEDIGASSATAGYLAKQKQRLYEKHLAPELDEMLAIDPDQSRRQSTQSPLLELIADLSRSANLQNGSHMVVVSDLLQNSDSVSFCRVQNDMPPFSAFSKRAIYKNRLQPNSLEGVSVDLLMIQRPGYGRGGLRFCASEDELAQFWLDYFDANGASARIIRIRHGIVGG